jgi:hypothetical protein
MLRKHFASSPSLWSTPRHKLDPTFDAGEVRRYLRFARLEEDRRKITRLLRRAKEHAAAAWRIARLIEKQEEMQR